MADWDVIAKQRLTEDWTTLRTAYLPLNQAMRRTVEYLEKGEGSFQDLLAGARERLDGSMKGLTALCTRRSPWVRLEAIRNLRVLGTGLKGAANDDPRALLRFLFALSELLSNVWKEAPTEARVTENLVLSGAPEFWFGCDCCAVGVLRPGRLIGAPRLTPPHRVRPVVAWRLARRAGRARMERPDDAASGRVQAGRRTPVADARPRLPVPERGCRLRLRRFQRQRPAVAGALPHDPRRRLFGPVAGRAGDGPGWAGGSDDDRQTGIAAHHDRR